LDAIIGVPANLNGYVTVPLVEVLQSQVVSLGATMSLVISGGACCIPAAIAVVALIKPQIFFIFLL
jgi:hypothetical protein